MKILLLIAALALSPIAAHAYSSNVGADPKNGSDEIETRQVVKSGTAGVSDAVSAGHILSYDAAADGYTMTRVGANTPRGTNLVACVAAEAIATGDTAYRRCVTKGYVSYLRYDATTAIAIGDKLCVNSVGAAVVCAGTSPDPANVLAAHKGSATANSGIVSLEAKASGTGSNLKAIVNIK